MQMRAAASVAMAAAAMVAITGCGGGGHHSTAQAAVEASLNGCGTGWSGGSAGPRALRVHNSGNVSTGVDLTNVTTGAVYGELEGLAPGVTRTMHVALGGGTYLFRCLPDDASAVSGPRIKVTGPAAGGPAAVPVTKNDLYAPTQAYRTYVTQGLKALATKTDALKTAVDGGDLAAARSSWLPAHLAYERLGAAYGTFDDFDGEINGRPDGLPGGVHDPGFTGFHRVEYGLWHGESAGSLRKAADRLDSDVHGLVAAFPQQEIDPGDLGLRAHEIMENSLQFQLSGEADQGSGTSLATMSANLEGTTEVLAVLRPILATRYPGMPQVDAWLKRTEALVGAQDHGGTWTPAGGLAQGDRERLDGAVGELLENLAPIASICTIRRTS
jgi:iron uptake system component EfeO